MIKGTTINMIILEIIYHTSRSGMRAVVPHRRWSILALRIVNRRLIRHFIRRLHIKDILRVLASVEVGLTVLGMTCRFSVAAPTVRRRERRSSALGRWAGQVYGAVRSVSKCTILTKSKKGSICYAVRTSFGMSRGRPTGIP